MEIPLAALTALVPVRRPGDVEIPLAALRFPGAIKAVEICVVTKTMFKARARSKSTEV